MGIFISVGKTVECIVVAVLFALALCACAFRLLGALQECGYGGKKLVRWAKKKSNVVVDRHLLLALLCAFSAAVLALTFSFAGGWSAIISLAGFIIFMPLFVWADNKIALKVPVSFTARFKRLYVVFAVLSAILIYLAVTLLNFADELWGNGIFSMLRYVPLAAFPALLIPLTLLANILDKAYEVPRNRKFVKKARQKIAASHIKVVGITGSYGKTTVKNCLQKILESKYRVLSTPSSFNTPLGISMTVNNANLDDYDIFIAEMGAKNIGDIAELCEICPPDYSIITGICEQHLETFKTLENIVKAKGEILTATKCAAVIENEIKPLFAAYSCPNLNSDCVSDVVSDCNGNTFKLRFDGEEREAKTRLLGAHAVRNIALCAALAHELGVGIDEIAAACEELDFVQHRLQLMKANGVNILDDGYNSNIRGAAAAVEVLKYFPGEKVVVTPGLVELGVLEESENRALGGKLVGLDRVILVGDTLVKPVKEGYLAAGGDEAKLTVVPTLEEAKTKLNLKAGDSVLFLNDLPDIY